ncbi:MAG: Gfo/Idh/MocA family oxidoreductase [Defluviitaleaceae bacterium]|nr:Gfo/Idh/MocA family oxidoreductase [Defluviitaleaceae bacterium]
MFNVGLVGLGFMGAGHLNTYQQMEKDGLPVKLAAVCDVDEAKFKAGAATQGNIKVGSGSFDLSAYSLYNDMDEMIACEQLDAIDICLPTYLHGPASVRAMEAGKHVFCEKPMAISSEMCGTMISASKRTGMKLMIGHTLRYWNVYEFLKSVVDENKFGKCISGYFFRGGQTPRWSWQNWLLTNEKSGGALLDQHIHDVDAINWLFGVPKSVSSIGRVVFPGSGYDAVSTNYFYGDMVINAQDDWTINGDGYGFEMLFRVNFERGAVVLGNGKFKVCPNDGKVYEPELSSEPAYYKELRLFYEYLNDLNNYDCIPLLESHRDTIRIAEAERESCDKNGASVAL